MCLWCLPPHGIYYTNPGNAIVFLETLGPGVHLDVALAHTTHLNVVVDQAQFAMAVASHSRTMHPSTLQKLLRPSERAQSTYLQIPPNPNLIEHLRNAELARSTEASLPIHSNQNIPCQHPGARHKRHPQRSRVKALIGQSCLGGMRGDLHNIRQMVLMLWLIGVRFHSDPNSAFNSSSLLCYNTNCRYKQVV